MVCSNDCWNLKFAMVSIMLVRRITILMLLVGAPFVTYAIGQWIDGDNLFRGLESVSYTHLTLPTILRV